MTQDPAPLMQPTDPNRQVSPGRPTGQARSIEIKQGMFAAPHGYPSVLSWFLTGALRDKRGVLGALIATWLNLPMAIAAGALGLLSGVIFGYFGGLFGGRDIGSEYAADVPILGTALDSFLLQGGGILGAIVGAVLGVIGGFIAGLILPLAVVDLDPAQSIGLMLGQLLTALLVGTLYTAYGVAAEGLLLRVRGVREPSRREQELLLPIVAECADRLRLGSYPKVMMDDSREPNAFAGARHIIITRGFFDEFNYHPEPLAGVICHELTHWRNADAISGLFIRGVALPLYVGYMVIMWLSRVFAHPLIRLFLFAVAWPLIVCIRYVVMPAQAAGSRRAEYLADQGAVVAGAQHGLRRVLARFRHSFDGARNGWEMSVCATHPPNELRLERLEQPGTKYPLPDADAPAMPLPVVVSSTLTRD